MEDLNTEEPVFNDLDELKHFASLVDGFIKSSRNNKFKPVSLSFEQLKSLHDCLQVGIERTEQFNKLAKTVKDRDITIGEALQVTELQFSNLYGFINEIKKSLQSVTDLSKVFLPKE